MGVRAEDYVTPNELIKKVRESQTPTIYTWDTVVDGKTLREWDAEDSPLRALARQQRLSQVVLLARHGLPLDATATEEELRLWMKTRKNLTLIPGEK